MWLPEACSTACSVGMAKHAWPRVASGGRMLRARAPVCFPLLVPLMVLNGAMAVSLGRVQFAAPSYETSVPAREEAAGAVAHGVRRKAGGSTVELTARESVSARLREARWPPCGRGGYCGWRAHLSNAGHGWWRLNGWRRRGGLLGGAGACVVEALCALHSCVPNPSTSSQTVCGGGDGRADARSTWGEQANRRPAARGMTSTRWPRQRQKSPPLTSCNGIYGRMRRLRGPRLTSHHKHRKTSTKPRAPLLITSHLLTCRIKATSRSQHRQLDLHQLQQPAARQPGIALHLGAGARAQPGSRRSRGQQQQQVSGLTRSC